MTQSQPPAPNMPESYASKLRRARARRSMHGERRVITMLFCDVTGSSAMAEDLDPEEWAEIMNDAFEFMINPIYKYEGTVARLMGDAVLAFFGAPIAHEDDPQRAVLAGLEIVAGIQPFCQEIKVEYGMDFNVRVGINTGPVVVGDVGSDLALEYTAMGDAINLASRMESTAEPGSVQISEYTHRLIAPLFEFHDRGPLQVKGKSEPVRTYTVSGLQQEPGRLRGIRGLETPLIGREREFDQLAQIIDDLLAEGKGRIVVLTGKAGFGKSRLIAELFDYWQSHRTPTADDWGHWAQMNAASFGASQPYGMIKHLLRSRYTIQETDTPEVIRAKLNNVGLFYPEPIRSRMLQLYAILFGVVAADGGLHPEGPDFKRELFNLLVEGSELQIGTTPTIFVADDLQWGDPLSIEYVESLFPLVENYPVLLLASMRPERDTPAWTAIERTAARFPDHYLQLNLQRLDPEESDFLIDNLLAIADLPPELLQRIREKAGGNPFFIEEVVRSLLESEAVTCQGGAMHWDSAASWSEFTVPDSIQALLVARIDRLTKELKRTLQLAAVIGPTFYERVLAAVSDTTAALDQQLLSLQEKEMIRETIHETELEYAFRHSMTRDATYNTILRRRRRQFHRRVAEAIESLFPARLEEEASRLAYHFQESRQLEKALVYTTLAAENAGRLYAISDAAELYRQAIDLARQVGSDEQLIDLYNQRGRNFEVAGQYDQAQANYLELRALAAEQNNDVFLLQSLLGEGTILATYSDRFDPQKGRAVAEQSLAIARRLDHPQGQAKALWILMLLDTYTGVDPASIVNLGEQAVAIARQHQLPEELAYVLHDLARPYLSAGRLLSAQKTLEEAGQLWRELGNMPMLADNLTTLAAGHSFQGQLAEAIELGEEALEISRAISNNWGQAYSLAMLAPIYMDHGQFQQALAAWQDSIPAARQANFAGPQIFSYLKMALALDFLGDYQQANGRLEKAAATAEGLGQLPLRLLVRLAQAKINLSAGRDDEARAFLAEPVDISALNQAEPTAYTIYLAVVTHIGFTYGEYEQVLRALDEGIDAVTNRGLRIALLELQQFKAEALLHFNRFSEAEALLLEARANAQAYGARKPLLLILSTLIQAVTILNKEADIVLFTQEGQQLARELAENIQDKELKGLFLASPLVQTFAIQ